VNSASGNGASRTSVSAETPQACGPCSVGDHQGCRGCSCDYCADLRRDTSAARSEYEGNWPERPRCDAVRYESVKGANEYEDIEVRCPEPATVEVPLSDGRLHPRCKQHIPMMLRALARPL
jgi:hypothetical protein